MRRQRRPERIARERLEHRWGKSFRDIYRELRVVRGLDMQQTAEMCGVSRTTIWRWLRDPEASAQPSSQASALATNENAAEVVETSAA